MAKPGSDAARELSGRAEDLARFKMSDEEARESTEMMELSLGLRCNGCGRRVGRGFEFVSIAVKEKKVLMKLSACSRDDCGYATLCREGATYVKEVHNVWLDEAGLEADPAVSIVRQNEKLAAQRTAEANGREGRAEGSEDT